MTRRSARGVVTGAVVAALLVLPFGGAASAAAKWDYYL